VENPGGKFLEETQPGRKVERGICENVFRKRPGNIRERRQEENGVKQVKIQLFENVNDFKLKVDYRASCIAPK